MKKKKEKLPVADLTTLTNKEDRAEAEEINTIFLNDLLKGVKKAVRKKKYFIFSAVSADQESEFRSFRKHLIDKAGDYIHKEFLIYAREIFDHERKPTFQINNPILKNLFENTFERYFKGGVARVCNENSPQRLALLPHQPTPPLLLLSSEQDIFEHKLGNHSFSFRRNAQAGLVYLVYTIGLVDCFAKLFMDDTTDIDVCFFITLLILLGEYFYDDAITSPSYQFLEDSTYFLYRVTQVKSLLEEGVDTVRQRLF